MNYTAICHICQAVWIVDGPQTGILICRQCTTVLRSLVTEHKNADIMSGIIETISPEEEAAEHDKEEVESRQDLGSLEKTLKRNRTKKNEE